MKKVVTLLFSCVLLLWLTACGNAPQFEDQYAMLSYLEGMWQLNDSKDVKTYYVFSDGHIYKIDDTDFTTAVEDVLEYVMLNGKLQAFYYTDFSKTLDRISAEDFLMYPETNITYKPESGMIVFDEGTGSEKTLVVSQTNVSLTQPESASSLALTLTLTKLSDTLDFSGEHFSKLFEKTKNNYKAPSSLLFPTPEMYTNALKEIHPYINDFELVSQEKNSTVYTLDGNLTNSGACLIIGKDSVFFSEGKPVKDQGAPFVVMYEPGDSLDLFVSDRRYTSLSTLLKYAEPVLKQLPGTLESAELVSLFEKKHATSNGARTFETTVNNITYEIIQSTNDKTTAIYVKVANYLEIPEAAKSASVDTANNGSVSSGSVSFDSVDSSASGSVSSASSSNSSDSSTSSENSSSSGNSISSSSSSSNSSTTSCNHSFAAATCAKPKTCTKCGATTGSMIDHSWKSTSCTTPHACSFCGTTLMGSTPGHQWQRATCTSPEYCSVCKETQGEASGHCMRFTKCIRKSCDLVDYSCIANTYTKTSAYGYISGTTTEIDLEVTNVSVSSSGLLSFSFNGNDYTLSVKQNSESDDSMAYFDCYLDGKLVKNATFRAGSEAYDNRIYLDWDGLDGYWLSFKATQ